LRILFLISFIVTFVPANLLGQCCGGHSSVGDNTNQGTLPKHNIQFSTYYRYAYSEGYMTDDHVSDFDFVKNAYSDLVGVQLGFGIFKRFSVDAEMNYYINRIQNFDLDLGNNEHIKYKLNGQGPSGVTLSGRVNVLKDSVHDIEWTVGAGVKIPWSKEPQVVNSAELPLDVQPSNGAYALVVRSFLFKEFDDAKISMFMINSATFNTENPKEYREGNTYMNALFINKSFLKNWSAIFQLRNEIRDYAFRHGQRINSSGGYRFIAAPQINYNIKQKYNISVLYEQPVYQYYYGIQLKDLYAFSVNFNIRVGVTKKARELACVKPD